jgi:hypothetical protein
MPRYLNDVSSGVSVRRVLEQISIGIGKLSKAFALMRVGTI